MAKSVQVMRGSQTGWRSVARVATHPAAFFICATAALLVGTSWWWTQSRGSVIPNERWALDPNHIRINEAAPWYTPDDSRRLAQRILGLGLALDHVDLLPRAVEVVQTQPFIAAVESASKHYQGLEFRVQYRIPVAAIGDPSLRLRLIDRYGVVVALEHPDPAAESLLRVLLPALSPHVGKDWDVWPDQRVVEAAEVCSELGEHYRAWGVNRLVCYWRNTDVRSVDAPWELWTPSGARILWRDTLVGDRLDPRVKIAAINDWIAVNGSLDTIPAGYVLDVRQGVPHLIPQLRSAQLVDGWR